MVFTKFCIFPVSIFHVLYIQSVPVVISWCPWGLAVTSPSQSCSRVLESRVLEVVNDKFFPLWPRRLCWHSCRTFLVLFTTAEFSNITWLSISNWGNITSDSFSKLVIGTTWRTFGPSAIQYIEDKVRLVRFHIMILLWELTGRCQGVSSSGLLSSLTVNVLNPEDGPYN